MGSEKDLKRLAGALEGLAMSRPILLVYIQERHFTGELLYMIRHGDFVFAWEDGYLLVLQVFSPGEAEGTLQRLLRTLPHRKGVASHLWTGGPLSRALEHLKAHAYLEEKDGAQET